MKEWIVIHKIKALYNNGSGLSKRQIAKELGISRNSVNKYLSLEVSKISHVQDNNERKKVLDIYKDYILHLLNSYPNLSAVKIMRKLKDKYQDINVSDRTVRRYVEDLKETSYCKQERYYQPVLDMVPGVQCQVDPGELSDVIINGVPTTVYFVVFVLSYSRVMYVGLSAKPINTDILIKMHDAAFRYFGGCVEECVYDQTKMVVINEEYRELVLNQRFHEYATYAGFTIRACEGYDPESKGKVESGVKYVKFNGLYGETFANWSDLESYKEHWLDTISNERCHGTTGVAPKLLYESQEKPHMRSYNTPSIVQQDGHLARRKSDKTGLISWEANKYSVPMLYQRSIVGVKESNSEIIIYDLMNNNEIARHNKSFSKGRIIQNRHHYRDLKELIADLEAKIFALLGDEPGIKLCNLIKITSPAIYKDQLRGIIKILSSTDKQLSREIIDKLCSRQRLTATSIRDYLNAYISKQDNETTTPKDTAERVNNAQVSSQLACYKKVLPQLGGLNGIH
jgi:transposase